MIAYVFGMLVCFQPAGLTPEVSRLDNGLQVVFVPERTAGLVSVQLWYRVGSADDDPRRPGLCQVARTLLELCQEVPEPLRAADVHFESRTLRDACCFAWFLRPDLLDECLRLEAQRMECRTLDRGHVETARRTAAQRARNPDPALSRLLAGAFPDHPYQHPPEWTAESLDDLSPDDVEEFLRRWFVPGNATLLVIGDVQPPVVRELVRRHFGPLPWAEPPRRARFPLPKAETVESPATTGDRAGLDVAWVTGAAGSDESLASACLMQRLCNPVDGPLCAQLLATGCLPPRWRQESWRGAGMAILTVDIDAQRMGGGGIPNIERIIREVLERAASTVPTEIELNRARALAARAARLRRADFRGRALTLGFYEVVAGDLMLAEWELPRITQLHVADLQHAANDLAHARTVWLRRSAEASPSARPYVGIACSNPTSSQPANPQMLSDFICVTIRPDPASALAVVRTLVTADADIAEAMGALMAVGSNRHSVEQIRDYLSYHGLDIFPVVYRKRVGLESRGPSACVPQMIEVHAELLRQPNRDEATAVDAAEHGQTLQRWLRAAISDDADWYVPPGLIGWRPPAEPLTNPTRVRRALELLGTYRPVEIVVGGNVETAAVLDAIRTAWDGWGPSAISQPALPSP